ncbi:MAG: DUF4080 domain-containing protein [Fusobacteria bacterium]|nr:DUF4080 domain-containing protein [Fusobacteriota bacterium]
MSKLKILLVGINSKSVHINLASYYLREVVGPETKVLEYTINQPLQVILSNILEHDFDVIGFSCYIWNIESVIKLSQMIKLVKKEAVLVLGGPEVSFHILELLAQMSWVDYVVSGEGEEAFPALLEAIKTGRVCRHESVYSKEKIQGSYATVSDFNQVKFPYKASDLAMERIIYYEFSRGCPFSCSYCLSSTFRGVRCRDIELAKSELSYLIEKKVKLVKFVDRTFNAHPRSLELLRYLKEDGGETLFHFEICADLLTQEWMEFLATTPKNRFQFEIGVQTTNSETMKEISRVTKLDKLYENVKELQSMGNMHLHLDLIVGLPYEGMESFKKSFNDIFQLRPDALQIGFLKVLKGSEIEIKSDKYEIIYTPYAPYEVLQTKWLNFHEISALKWFEECVERYYNSKKFSLAIQEYVKLFPTAFDAFFNLSLNIKKMLGLDKNVPFQAIIKLLHTCFFDKETSSEAREHFEKLLYLDYLCLGREKGKLEFFLYLKPQEKDRVSIFYANNVDAIWEAFPHYHGEKKEQFQKNISIYYFDSFKLNENNVYSRPVFIAIDYGKREKTHKANYKILVESS